MKYAIFYKAEVIADLKEIKNWYENISPQVVGHFQKILEKTESNISKNPFAYPVLNFMDFRRILLTPFPYKMIYKIEKDKNKLIVFAVLHTARSTKLMKQRLKK